MDNWLNIDALDQILDTYLSPDGRFLAKVGVITLVTLTISRLIPLFLQLIIRQVGSNETQTAYRSVFSPYNGLIGWVISLTAADIAIQLFLKRDWAQWLELGVSLVLAVTLAWLGSRIFRQYFDVYLLDAAVRGGRKVNSELLVVAKFAVNIIVVIAVVIIFAEAHDFNIFGLFASLGIGGLAIAFAAQKTLEQFLGGVVIYIDRPFTVDDYIGLSDGYPGQAGTFGRVESIGLRSTRIRTSGKGTVVVVPNNVLSQSTIENYTGAKKVMSIIEMNFRRPLPGDECALVRQVILQSTSDIFGIDSRSTDVIFREIDGGRRTQAQITFFILGSGNVSMELRRQLLDIANQNIAQKLREYDIQFEVEAPTVYVDSPITI